MTGKIFDIQRFCTNDGPGIRTVVFFKGCSLSCAWCHNPESKQTENEILYNEKSCIQCTLCEAECTEHQHSFDSAGHIFSRDNCNLCMKCVDACPSGALKACGEEKSADDIVEATLRDRQFYEQSGGGVTLSGGEPLMQFEFALELLKKLKKNGIHTAVETSGYCTRDLSEINEYVDLWLYDIKLFPEAEHVKYTGKSNEIILKNLYLLDSLGAKIILRCPIIPDINMNESHFFSIAELAQGLKNVVAINLEPYHPLGIEKAAQLGKRQEYNNERFVNNDDLRSLIDGISNKTKVKLEVL